MRSSIRNRQAAVAPPSSTTSEKCNTRATTAAARSPCASERSCSRSSSTRSSSPPPQATSPSSRTPHLSHVLSRRGVPRAPPLQQALKDGVPMCRVHVPSILELGAHLLNLEPNAMYGFELLPMRQRIHVLPAR